MSHRILRQWTLDIKKEVPPSLNSDTVIFISFPGVPMLTQPHELNLSGLATAVLAGCFEEKGHICSSVRLHKAG